MTEKQKLLNEYAQKYAEDRRGPDAITYRNEAWKLAFSFFKNVGGRYFYYQYNLGEEGEVDTRNEEGMDYPIRICEWLERFDPAKATFTTYMERQVEYLYRTRSRRLGKSSIRDKDGNIKKITKDNFIDRGIDIYDEKTVWKEGKITELDWDTQDTPSTLKVFGYFARILEDRQRVMEGIRSYQKMKPRYRVFYTRDYLILCCPVVEEKQYQMDRDTNRNFSRAFSQPYIYYLSNDETTNEADALQRMQEIGFDEKDAIMLYKMWQDDQLLVERYRTEQSLNAFLGKSNQHDVVQKYEELRLLFFTKHQDLL